ncbi:unnamed protein product [Haemonchus placei]|uniref:Uncharacterized protein n=1 Tax=Haemonchus placei TaxID=6290 RepID=A0A3P7ZMP9_HAEPC|nr:unnamed protein product [Haemonchus placei]
MPRRKSRSASACNFPCCARGKILSTIFAIALPRSISGAVDAHLCSLMIRANCLEVCPAAACVCDVLACCGPTPLSTSVRSPSLHCSIPVNSLRTSAWPLSLTVITFSSSSGKASFSKNSSASDFVVSRELLAAEMLRIFAFMAASQVGAIRPSNPRHSSVSPT